jgi:hypothetical protein
VTGVAEYGLDISLMIGMNISSLQDRRRSEEGILPET